MSGRAELKDLLILTADKNTKSAVEGVLTRPRALHIRQVTTDVFVHPHSDPGCLRESHEFLRPFTKQYRHALVIFDREGCGKDLADPRELENSVEQELANSGWSKRNAVIVLDPELEIWIWSDSPHVADVLGWTQGVESLRNWLIAQSYLRPGDAKPQHPKEAMEGALREVRRSRSSAVYAELAKKVSFARCNDLAFEKLKATLRNWFSH